MRKLFALVVLFLLCLVLLGERDVICIADRLLLAGVECE